MIVKCVKISDNMDRENQTDIVKTIERSSGFYNFWLLLIVILIFAFLVISISADASLAAHETSAGDETEANISGTHGSGRVLWDKNIATALGVARIQEDTAQGILLGRRGALTDARRNLLILRHKLLKYPEFSEKGGKRFKVSGRIRGVVIHSERVKDNLYYLQVDIPLDKLLEEGVVIDENI